MQPLRGLAVLSDLPPIPEILDGIERAIGAELYQTHEPHDVALLFDVGARALSSAAQEVASLGAVPSDSAEAQDFVRRLGALLDVGGDVVPIEVLYFDDDGPHVVKEGTQSATPGRLVELDLSSLFADKPLSPTLLDTQEPEVVPTRIFDVTPLVPTSDAFSLTGVVVPAGLSSGGLPIVIQQISPTQISRRLR